MAKYRKKPVKEARNKFNNILNEVKFMVFQINEEASKLNDLAENLEEASACVDGEETPIEHELIERMKDVYIRVKSINRDVSDVSMIGSVEFLTKQ